MKSKIKREKQQRRHKRVRVKISGTAEAPRLCVFRSAKYIYAQLIDDQKRKTIIAVDDRKIKREKINPVRDFKKRRETKKGQISNGAKIDKAWKVGKLIAKEAIKKKIKKVVFDRRGYKYHGRVKAIAEGAREGGLRF